MLVAVAALGSLKTGLVPNAGDIVERVQNIAAVVMLTDLVYNGFAPRERELHRV